MQKTRWKEYPPDKIIYPYCVRWWQKKLMKDQFIQLVECNQNGEIVYELDMQIHRDDSIIKQTLNIKGFTYRSSKPPFKQAEEDARKIIALLTLYKEAGCQRVKKSIR